MSKMHAYLQQLHESGLYPFHMPGHKQRTDLFEEDMPALSGAYGIDFTETAFTDDLHHPEGMLADLEARANSLYGDGREDLETHLLVNGSTAGVLAAVSALTNEGDTVIVARNAHSSLYHALYLRRLRVIYVQPQISEAYAFAGPISPDDVANAIGIAPEAKAVFITSPTYEGVLSDVALIAVLTHAHGIPLVIDEAHGSHLGLYPGIPRGALWQGADVVVHSLHKTLAGMTQTALLHMQGALVDREKIRRFLHIYQTTSPSFPLMVSVDAAVSDLAKNGAYRFETLLAYKQTILTESVALRTMRVAPVEAVPDPAKVVILPELINGLQLAYMLRTEYRIEPEMALQTHVVCIITPYDTAEGIERLMDALYGIDREIFEAVYGPETESLQAFTMAQGVDVPEEIAAFVDTDEDTVWEAVAVETEGTTAVWEMSAMQAGEAGAEENPEAHTERIWERVTDSPEGGSVRGALPQLPVAYMPIADAWDAPNGIISLAEAAGLISADFIYAYPPGIPLIVPGEAFTEELCVHLLSRCAAENLYGVTRDGMVRCVLSQTPL